jgi:hypothetical protein
MRLVPACLLLLAAGLIAIPAPTYAEGVGGGDSQPTPPVSTGSAAILNSNLEAGAGGLYAPVGPGQTPPVAREPVNPLTIPPPPNPQGKSCPQNTAFHVGPAPRGPGAPGGSILRVLNIYPAFTRNAKGGYDGTDATFGYSKLNAIPPGGDPNQTQIGALATAATVPGHILGVAAWITTLGTWQDASPTPPFGGSCQGAQFAFGPPFIAGNAPPPPPARAVLNNPPFGLGPQLLAQVTRFWRIGTVSTLPGPAPTAPTYVHIPTCAWLDSNVPSDTTLFHALTSTVSGGVTLFLLYDVTVTPGTVTWEWGDGTLSTSASTPESPPSTLPSYDPTAQTWTDPCAASHRYQEVASGRTITATESFTVSITVSWDDGVTVHTASVPCDPVSLGPCALVIGAQQGWTSGPHAVNQIEGVPYFPTRS